MVMWGRFRYWNTGKLPESGMKLNCNQSSEPCTKKRRQRVPSRNEESNVSPEPVPINASALTLLVGYCVTRLIDPPSAFGPSNGEEYPRATWTSAMSLVRK